MGKLSQSGNISQNHCQYIGFLRILCYFYPTNQGKNEFNQYSFEGSGPGIFRRDPFDPVQKY